MTATTAHEFSPRRVALAGLLRCAEPPVAEVVAEFVAALGAEDAWAAISRRQAPAGVAAAVAPRLASLGSDELHSRGLDDLRRAAEVGAAIYGPGDSGWPGECFTGLTTVRPFEGCPHAASPLALYRRGEYWPRGPQGSISVVGSRAATPYGVRIATEFGADAADAGFGLISGAAFGIDAAAHRGALSRNDPSYGDAQGGLTMAILACGIDRAYPAAHRALLDTIAECGSVVSEYPPGSVPARHRFLVRNRLIAAFAEATVVVEAGRRSGSLNTATTAANLCREVLAVPGPVTSAMSLGCHDLIRDGKAQLVTSWADLSGLLGPLQPALPPNRPGDRRTDGLDLVASRVYESLPARGAVSVDALSMEAALPVVDVIGALAVLQADGLARRRDGMWCRA